MLNSSNFHAFPMSEYSHRTSIQSKTLKYSRPFFLYSIHSRLGLSVKSTNKRPFRALFKHTEGPLREIQSYNKSEAFQN